MKDVPANWQGATRRKALAYALGPVILSGCGGGGSSAPPPSSAPAPAPSSAPAPPSISQQPVDTTAIAGAAVSFSVGLSNGSEARYQWLRNGVEIAGATQSSFTYASASLLDSGASFSVRIANPVGSASSQSARLSVLSPAFTLVAGVVGGPASDLDGVGSNARFASTSPMAIDRAGNVYVATFGAIRKVTPGGAVTTFVGELGQTGRRDGAGSAARISGVSALEFDRVRNVLVFLDGSAGTNDATCNRDYTLFCPTATGFVREVTPDGMVTTRQPLSTAATFSGVSIAPDGSLYTAGGNAVDDSGGFNFFPRVATAIYKIAAGGDAVVVAGNPNLRGYKDGSASEALFSRIQGIAADAKGNVYVADRTRLRKLSPDGVVTTVAGDPGLVGPVDGQGTAAAFSSLNSIAVDGSGNVLVADSNLIRRISPDGSVSTVAQVTPFDPFFLQGIALSSAGVLHIRGFNYVGRFEPIPG